MVLGTNEKSFKVFYKEMKTGASFTAPAKGNMGVSRSIFSNL